MAAKETMLRVRLDESELEEWQAAAGEAGVSEMVRQAVRAYLRDEDRRDAAAWRRVVAMVRKETGR